METSNAQFEADRVSRVVGKLERQFRLLREVFSVFFVSDFNLLIRKRFKLLKRINTNHHIACFIILAGFFCSNERRVEKEIDGKNTDLCSTFKSPAVVGIATEHVLCILIEVAITDTLTARIRYLNVYVQLFRRESVLFFITENKAVVVGIVVRRKTRIVDNKYEFCEKSAHSWCSISE